jgi:hypothetical protein
MGIGRWLAPAAVAGAVLVVVVAPSWVTGRSDRDAGGPDTIGQESPSPIPSPSAEPVTLVSYAVHGRRLTITYTVDVAGCYAGVSDAQVDETADDVTVTLRRLRSQSRDDCTHLTLTDAVDVPLDAPLAGRLVRDGGRGGAVVPPDLPETSR